MPIEFPSSPSNNQTFTVLGRTYRFAGNRWRKVRPSLASVQPSLEIDNDFAAAGTLHVDADTGRVGIGTANPAVDLHVDGDVEFTGTLDVTGVITTPTPLSATNDTTVATTAYVTTAISDLIGGAPAALDTLNELAAALNDDSSYAATITTALAGKLDTSAYTAADVLAKLITVDGAGSSLDADTLDGSHASAFAPSAHTHSYLPLSGGILTGELVITGSAPQMKFSDAEHDDFWIHVNANNFYILPDRDDSGNWETPYALQLEADTNTAYTFGNRILTVADEGTGNGLDADTLDGSHASAFAASSHTHSYAATSHTHSYLPTSGGTVSGDLAVTGRFQIGGHYIDDVAGTGNPYGSINVGGAMSWDGYAIDQRVVFMHDGSSAWGIYNDVNNEWMIYGTLNGGVELKYNNTTRLWTDNSGGRTTGRHYTDGSNYAYSYYGHSNIAGTGNAIHTPNGIYSTGTNWLYGTILTNGSAIGSTGQQIGDVYAAGWLRTYGQRGWYSQSYGGGWYMTDSTWLRSYSSKFVYTNGGKFESRYINGSKDWSAQPVILTASHDIGVAVRSYDSDTHTGQLRAASGTWYARNHNDGAYWTVAAYWYNPSSRTLKQDIASWGEMKPLSSAVNTTYDTTATDLMKQLRVVSYRHKKQNALPADIKNERRSEALDRLNSYRLSRGLDAYDGEEAVHKCGRDCEGSDTEPCDLYRNWELGTIGFVAEEVAEIIPEATNIDLYERSPTKGTNAALDPMALIALLTKTLQETESRLAALEARLS